MNSPKYTIELSQEELTKLLEIIWDSEYIIELSQEELNALLEVILDSEDLPESTILRDIKRKLEVAKDQIIVEVRRGIAYCEDPRVKVIDYDNKESPDGELLEEIENLAISYRNNSNYDAMTFGEDICRILRLK